MAIQFLNTINFNQNSLTNVVIDPTGSAPTTTEGAMYYDTTDDIMYYRNASAWVPMDGSGTGVTTFTNTNGTFVAAGTQNSTATGAVTMGTIDLSATGTASGTTFLRGDNTWATPAGAYSWWKLEGDNVTTVNVTDGLRVDFQGDTGITTTVTAGTPNVLSIDLDDTSVTPGAYTYSSFTVDQQGRLTAAASGSAPGTMDDWTVRDSGDDDEVIDDNKFLKFVTATGALATNLSGAGTTGDPFIMTLTSPDTNTTYSAMTNSVLGLGKLRYTRASTPAAETQTETASRTYGVTDNSSNQLVVNVPWTDNNDNYTYSLSVGAVSSNESTLSLVGAGGGSTSTAKFSGTTDEIEITTPGTGDGGDITIGLPAAVTITTSLDISGSAVDALNIASGKAQTAATTAGDVDATLTTKGYVDGLVTGGLQFKGTFRADTGQIIGGSTYIYQLTGSAFDPSATRVAVEVGDYYVCATAGGDFYGDGGTGTCSPTRPITVGDSIIGVTAASANASDCADWSIVESNEGVTTFTNANGTYVSASTVNSNATGAVTVGTIDLSAVDGTSDTATRFLSKDNTWDVPSYTSAGVTYTLDVTQDGSNVDMLLDASSGTDSTVQFTAGSNITLTRDSASAMTIAATNTTYAAMTTSTLGLGKLRYTTGSTPAAEAQTTTASRTYGVTENASNQLVVNVPWVDNNTTYSCMTDSTLGLAKVVDNTTQTVAAESVTSTISRSYAVQKNSSCQLVVNVPWTDTTGAVTSVTASAVNDELGAIISPTTGAVVVGVDIKGQTNLGAAPAEDDELLIWDKDTDTNKTITVENLMQTVSNGAYATLDTGTAGVTQQVGPPAGTEGWVVATDTITGASDAKYVSCEVQRVSDGRTVFADVTRSGANITVNFKGSGISQGTYAVVINRVV